MFYAKWLALELSCVTERNPSMNERGVFLRLLNNVLTVAHSSEQADRMTVFVSLSALHRQADQPHSGVLSGQDRVL